MAITQNSVITGVFVDDVHAREAIQALRNAGLNEEALGFVTRSRRLGNQQEITEQIALGAAEGGLAGGVLGVLGALSALAIPGVGPILAGGILIGILGGAAAGGLIGALVTLGIPEREAAFYQHELAEGHPVVIVKSTYDTEQIKKLLREHGALHVQEHFSAFNATPSLRSNGTSPETYDPTVDSQGESEE
jgi:hypothetical protein